MKKLNKKTKLNNLELYIENGLVWCCKGEINEKT